MILTVNSNYIVRLPHDSRVYYVLNVNLARMYGLHLYPVLHGMCLVYGMCLIYGMSWSMVLLDPKYLCALEQSLLICICINVYVYIFVYVHMWGPHMFRTRYNQYLDSFFFFFFFF